MHRANVEDNRAEAPAQTAPRQSAWAKIYGVIERSNRALNTLGIGTAGLGTTLADSCTSRRGNLDIRTLVHEYRITNEASKEKILQGGGIPGYDEENITPWGDAHRIRPNVQNADGMHPRFRDFDCYAVDNNETNIHVIGRGNRAHENDVYTVTASPGGPGAIIITW